MSATSRLPALQGAIGSKPIVVMPQQAPPKELVVQTIAKGNGSAVSDGDTAIIHYVGAIWSSGREFESSWEDGAPARLAIGNGSLISGLDKALAGVTAGSRLMVVVPPNQGYGPTGKAEASILGTDTLVFVIDVFGSFPTPAS